MQRISVLLVLFILGVAACSDGPTKEVTETSGTGDPTTNSAGGSSADAPDGELAEFCTALEDVVAAMPGEGVVTQQQIQQFDAYAEAIEEAAAVAPDEQMRSALEDLADFVRDSVSDPTAAGTAERSTEVFENVEPVVALAEQECGIEELG